jgi:hypothetical protein
MIRDVHPGSFLSIPNTGDKKAQDLGSATMDMFEIE